MKVKTVDGHEVEIGVEEAKHVHDVMAGQLHTPQMHTHHHTPATPEAHMQRHAQNRHAFHINGREVHLTPGEMKIIADIWWENYGKHSMKVFFERYHKKASENIMKALEAHMPPASEEDVKGAIARAVSAGHPSLIAEVVFEAMEWQTAYAGLKSIQE